MMEQIIFGYITELLDFLETNSHIEPEDFDFVIGAFNHPIECKKINAEIPYREIKVDGCNIQVGKFILTLNPEDRREAMDEMKRTDIFIYSLI